LSAVTNVFGIMGNRKSVNWLAGAVIVAAAAGLYLFLFPTPPAIDARPHKGAGETLAGEALKLLEGNARLIVITRDLQSFKVPAAEAQLRGFLGALRDAGKAPAAVRSIKVDPLRVVEVPPGEFFDLIRLGKEDDVIVSFLGPPALADEQVAKLGAKRPRILALCSGGLPARVDLKTTFAQQLLHLAVVSRPDAPAQAGPGSERGAFEQMFKVITPGNVSELPALVTRAGTN
jgi:hypothetical protein